MNILHIVYGLDPKSGGPTRSIAGLCRSLAQSGVQLALFAHADEHPLQNPSGVVFRTGKGLGLKQLSRDVAQVIDDMRPDLIQLHGVWTLSNHVAARYARERGIPYIITPRGMLEPWSLNAKKWKKRLALWLYQRRDLEHAVALHATAVAEAEQLRKLGLQQPIIISPNGVDLPATMPPRTRRPDGKRTILFLSRIHPKKGVVELVEAWARLRNRQLAVGSGQTAGRTDQSANQPISQSTILDWHIEYAGPDCGGHLQVVQRRMRTLGVESDFTYLGDLSDADKWNAYRRADLFVLPTYSENFGIVVAEALAAGVPVLTTTGTPWQALVEYRCGWWVDPGTESLVKALPAVLETPPEELAAMGERGREYAFRTFSWESIAVEMKVAYEWLLQGGERPECVWPGTTTEK